MEHGLGLLGGGGGGIAPPFLKLGLTLGSIKSSNLHGA
jgi:hypothetical protein